VLKYYASETVPDEWNKIVLLNIDTYRVGSRINPYQDMRTYDMESNQYNKTNLILHLITYIQKYTCILADVKTVTAACVKLQRAKHYSNVSERFLSSVAESKLHLPATYKYLKN
jgi:hypothetical protein